MNENMESTVKAEESTEKLVPHYFYPRMIEMDKILAYWEKYSPREQRVLMLLIGLDGNRPRTLQEVAEEFGVSTARIQQIAVKALYKPYRINRRRPLREWLDNI